MIKPFCANFGLACFDRNRMIAPDRGTSAHPARKQA
jgi:hypothetical protein